MSNDIALKIMDSLASGQDGSLSMSGQSPKTGYMVGGVSWSMVVHPEMVDVYTVSDFLSAHAAVLSWEGYYVGWWTHKGRVHFDVSESIPDRTVALRIADSRGEIAIWSIDTSSEIIVEDALNND